MIKIFNLIKKYKFFTLAWLIVIAICIWYWGFAIHSNDLIQILVGWFVMFMSLSLPLSGIQADFIVEIEKERKEGKR